MEEPKYKICFKEDFLIPKYEGLLKDVIFVIVMILFIWKTFLAILGISTCFFSVIALVYLIIQSRKKWNPSDTELIFYEDRMVHYCPKRYYSRRKSRREYYTFYYNDITRIIYREGLHKMVIYGKLEGTFYDYTKDGEVQQNPSYHRTTDGLTRFYTTLEPNIDFVKILETYTSVKVDIVNA